MFHLQYPQRTSEYSDTIFDMVMRAIGKAPAEDCVDLAVRIHGLRVSGAGSAES